MLSHFEVPWLGAVESQQEVDRLLLEDCGRVLAPDGVRHWAMDDAVRRFVVAGATQEDLLGALDAVERRPEDSQQWAIEALVRGGGEVALEDLGLEQIRALASVCRWLDPATTADTGRAIDKRLRLRELTGSLKAVASEHFTGRDRELFELTRIRHEGLSPVLIRGFGGIGKSALLARYILTAAEVESTLFVYLNFNDVALDPRYPASLVLAIVRQLALQLDDAKAEGAERILQRARDRLRTSGREHEVQSRGLQVREEYVADLLYYAAELPISGRPLVLAFDTLEEVQRRDQSSMLALMKFLGEVREAMPTAQLLLAGRAPVPELHAAGPPLYPAELVLEGLMHSDAIGLLGVLYDKGDVDLDEIVSQVGTSPLCLRLAAGILRHVPAGTALRGLELGRVGVEGELYRRLLGHIPDRDVRRLAHPGLTLRRVTPDLIENVLARPCGVDVVDRTQAYRLFEALALEAMLVERDPADYYTLIHRADVRRMMLTRLAEDEPDVVAQIHRAAIRYYGERDGVAARTEELYHRLMLAQRERTLDARWDDAVLPGLVGSIDELPATSRAYVAGRDPKLGISEHDLREAELQTRRRLVQQRVQELIGEGQVTEAFGVLDMHRTETGDTSPLISDLLVQVLELQGRLGEARRLAERTRRASADSGSVEEFVTFSLHCARLAERMADVMAAKGILSEALEFTSSLEPTQRNQLLELRMNCALLGVRRRMGEPLDESLAVRAIELYDALGLRLVRKVPGLLRDLAAEVGSHSPRIVRAALRTVGVAPGEATRVRELPDGERVGWAENLERGEAGSVISGWIGEAEHDDSVHISETVSEIYKGESDSAIEYAPEETTYEQLEEQEDGKT